MKRIAIFLIVIVSLLAVQSGWSAGSSGLRQARSVHIEGSEWTVISPTVSFDNPDGCGKTDTAIIRSSDGGYKEKTTAAFLGLASGMNIVMWFSGCAATPWGGTAPIVYSIRVER